MIKKYKNILIPLAVILAIKPVFYIFVGLTLVLYHMGLEQYETTDIADYGNYIGNNDNERVQGFIDSFFPREIEEYFSEIKYSYWAEEGDTCAFEAYLEFIVENPDQYEKILNEHTAGRQGKTFSYAPEFTEYVHYDSFDLVGSLEEQEDIESGDFHISGAAIGKVLCCDEDQRIIFVALGVYDGGVASTEYLKVYFERFGIDPWEYAREHPYIDGQDNPLAG